VSRRHRDLVLLAPKETAALLARYTEGNNALAQKYLGRTDASLFNDFPCENSAPGQILANADTDNALAPALVLLIDDIHGAMRSRKATNSSQDSAAFADLPVRFRAMSDTAWLETLLRTTAEPVIDEFHFPGFPDPKIQAAFVGTSSEATIREAFSFYLVSKGYACALGLPLALEHRFLDFGVGWAGSLGYFGKISAPTIFTAAMSIQRH
jgi:hypothetical protein